MIYINGKFLTQKKTGSQRFAYEMTSGLVNMYGKDACVLVPNQQLNDDYNVDGFQIRRIGKLKSILWEQFDLPIFLYKNGSELLINFVNVAPVFYKNQFISILDMSVFINPKWFNKAFYYYYKILWPIIAKNSQKILTLSTCSKNDIVKLLSVPDEKVSIVYCGVSKQFLDKQNPYTDNDAILNRFNLKKSEFFLCVSSLDPRKNFIRLLKAYSEINDNKPPLVIVGSEGRVFANDELKSIISESTNIILTGYITDTELTYLYNSSYCFLYPSLYEGFGMPPLEAMAAGCPTIVSNTSSLPEVCGDASLYVEPTDTAAIKDAILTLYNDAELRMDLIKKGNIQYKKFTWEKAHERLKKVIDDFYRD